MSPYVGTGPVSVGHKKRITDKIHKIHGLRS